MSTLIVGSIAFDTVQTPFGQVEKVLGGTAVFFSVAASLFTSVNLVGVVGEDFPESAVELLRNRGVDLSGLQRRSGETFQWVGEYGFDMNVAHTLDTRLNVFETFHPTIPTDYKQSQCVFLGNIDPDLQLEVLNQVERPQFTALDSMNYWISSKRDALTAAIKQVDAVLINEGEIREYTGQYNVLEAAKAVRQLGPKYVIVKRGEYGALLFGPEHIFAVPSYPTFEVRDTTGAGDSFAGGFVGYLDSHGGVVDEAKLRAAMVFGTVVASFAVEDFSINGLARATGASMRERYARLAGITRIDEPLTGPVVGMTHEGAKQ